MSVLSTKSLILKYSNTSDYLHQLTDEELRRLHDYLNTIWLDIKAFCDSHGLTVMLAYGSALGAFRHKGFIPWDDDIDVFMPKDDYMVFLESFPKEYGEKYYVTSPLIGGYTTCLFGKVIDKRSKIVSVDSQNNDYCGAFVDIFPLENMPRGRFHRWCLKYLSYTLIYIFGCILMFQNKSSFYKTFMTSKPDIKFNYYLRRSLGAFFSFVSLEKWGLLYDSLVSYKKDTGLMHAPTGDYKWLPRRKDWYLPVGFEEYEKESSPVPGNITEYLKAEFGPDYMTLPSVDKRWRHPIRYIELPNNSK